jgi:tetratricopeptide (TPR) repeat protein
MLADFSCSNRSAALLKLNKVAKALSDADAAIQRQPDWDKGYFRKAAALEAQDKLEEVRFPAECGGC